MTRRARVRRLIVLGAVLVGLGQGAARAQEPEPSEAAPLVERVEVAQNQYLQYDTLLYYVTTKAGDRYDEQRLKEDFRRLWDTGFLSDLLLDVRDGKTGKIVTFVVQERKRVQIVDYRGAKSISTSNIEDELKKKEATLRIDSFYDPAKARRVEGIIRDMLVEKGRPFATVKHDAKTVGGAGMQVSFVVEEGPKAKVKRVEFAGNEVFSDRTLRGRMKKIKAKGFWNMSWLTGKTTYTAEKWSEDQEKLRDHYLNHGYVTATIGEPKLTYTDGKSGFFKKRPVKWVHLDIPVTEGDQYRVGEMKFEGMTVFKEEHVRPLFKLKTGDVYKESRLKKGYEKLREVYGANGYFQWTPLTKRKPDAERKVVDLTLSMDEDKKYYVGRIVFTGNSSTRDKVIRREVYMNEGDIFNTEALKLSIRRINQLGYFKPMEGVPDLHPSELGEDKIDVTFKVEEQNRNQFTFGGGVSGLEGTFINSSFSTSNFLGLGETFQISAQAGARTKNYQIAITEPYLFDRSITAGIDLFKRKVTYETLVNVVGFTQESTGASLVAGFPLGRFTRMFTSYSYEIINIQGLPTVTNAIDPVTGLPIPATTTTPTTAVFDPFIFGQAGRTRQSAVGPSVVQNTVDNPYTPRAGRKLTAAIQFVGGPLGGTVHLIKPDVEAILYIPHTKRTALGLRGQIGYLFPFGDTARIDPATGRDKLPYYQRFFLGGETQLRGYNIRSVGPLGEGNAALGGNKFALVNAEYYFELGGPLRFLFFFDAGQAYQEGEIIDPRKFRTCTGAELRFIMPVLNVPFRLIYAFNPNRDPFQPKSTFKFAVGTTF